MSNSNFYTNTPCKLNKPILIDFIKAKLIPFTGNSDYMKLKVIKFII